MPIFVKLLVLQAETAAGLCGLKDGGTFVIKIFTFFQSQSTSFLYLLTNLFEFVDVFKPATSKEGNSEVYVICKNLTPSAWLTATLEKLAKYYGDFPVKSSLFSQDEIPTSFLSELRKCGELFMQLQENVISNNLHYWNDQLTSKFIKLSQGL